MTNDTILRFVKDQRLPIHIYSEPYFSYLLELYDKDFHSKEAYEMLQKTIAQFPSEQAFLDEYYRIRDNVITTIKEMPEYEAFLNADMNKYQFIQPDLPQAFKGDVYKAPCIGQYFLSIDLKAANFQMLRLFDKKLVLGANTYDEFIAHFTDLEYFRRSKYTRQVIFGNMSPKRQSTMEKYYTYQILKMLMSEGISPAEIAVFTFDEIVLRTDDFVSAEKLAEYKSRIKEQLDLDISCESFVLKEIDTAYVKEKSDGTVAFKGAPGYLFPQIYKKYYGLPIEDMDKVFYYEGHLAKFI